MLRIHLFGQPRFTLDSEPFAFSARPKVLPLLAFLLLRSSRSVQRAEVASALWPDDPDADSLANLRRHLHYLQTLLPPAKPNSWLIVSRQSVQWNPASPYWLDVDEFTHCARSPNTQQQAVELYSGDLLESIDEEWLAEPRREFFIRYCSCLLDIAAAHRARRSFREAIHCLNTLLAHDPWREDALRAQLIILYELGDRAAAVAEFARFHASLRTEMGVEPMAETVAVYRAIVAGIPPPGAAPPPGSAQSATYPEPPLTGREIELQRLRDVWQESLSERARVAFISGEAGIGKSRIVREFATYVESQGGLAVFGGTSLPEAIPYQAVATVMRSLANVVPALRLDPIWLAALFPLVPELRAYVKDVGDVPLLELARERARLFEAVALVLEATAKNRPLCAVLEDLHWAGAATLEMSAYIVRRLRSSRILWLFTWRDEDSVTNVALRELRRMLDADDLAVRLPLRALAQDDSATILRAMGLGYASDMQAVARLHAFAEGNPLYLMELARNPEASLRENAALPDALRSALMSRTDHLNAASRTLLEICAVVGATFDLDIARSAAGWSEAQCRDAIEALIDGRFVKERSGPTFAFSHQLVASAVYDAIDPVQRARRHRRVAHAIELEGAERPESAAEVAEHYDRAGEHRRAAVAYVRAATFAVSLYAITEGRTYATRALELHPLLERASTL